MCVLGGGCNFERDFSSTIYCLLEHQRKDISAIFSTNFDKDQNFHVESAVFSVCLHLDLVQKNRVKVNVLVFGSKRRENWSWLRFATFC